MLIGATRCGVKCENTVLLEFQGPCESVRKCSADTVTDDTSARVDNVTERDCREPIEQPWRHSRQGLGLSVFFGWYLSVQILT